MRRFGLLVLVLPLLASCKRTASTQDPDPPPSSDAEPKTGEDANPDQPAPPVPGSFASVPLEDWPCGAEIDLQDGAGFEDVIFTYGRRQACLIPGDLVTEGVVGCPVSKVVTRGGDDPLYTIRYEYDEEGRLISTQEGETAPERYVWGVGLVRDRSTETLTYETSEGGFVVMQGGGVGVDATVSRGKVTKVLKRYANLSLELTLKWDGDRLVSVQSGPDYVVFDYTCRDANRT